LGEPEGAFDIRAGGWAASPINKHDKEDDSMSVRNRFTKVGLVLLAVFTLVAATALPARTGDYKDIVDTAVEAGSFNTLAKALTEAGLVETLKGQGPFTVFAPTDEAFAKLPAGTLESLLQDKAKLTAVLTYHVISGKVMAADVMKLTEAKTVQGQSVQISTAGGVMVDDAHVVKTDILASNGVIHVIDKVILPN
jgi:uncharacterized surface protein with fasciclin (FAS1) repeats